MSLAAIRRLAIDEVEACVEVARTVGWNTDPEAWRRMLSLGDAAGSDLGDGTLGGTIIVIPFGQELAMIAMMLVRPPYQRQGLGRRLMQYALAASASRLHCLYATPAGEKLYRPFGFVEAGSSTRFEGEASAAAVAPHAGARPMVASDLAAVADMDEAAQGARRQRLLESLALRHEAAWVVERDGRLCGFGLAHSDGQVRRVGPLVAPSDDDAIAIADRLVVTGARTRLDLEPGERLLRSWAESRALRETETTLRMTLGPGAMPGARAHSRLLVGRPFG